LTKSIVNDVIFAEKPYEMYNPNINSRMNKRLYFYLMRINCS